MSRRVPKSRAIWGEEHRFDRTPEPDEEEFAPLREVVVQHRQEEAEDRVAGNKPRHPYASHESPTTLYRLFDRDGGLLYVGITSTGLHRLKEHARSKHWFFDAVNVTLEHFPTRVEALDAETLAIHDENPRHNIMRPVPMAVPKPTAMHIETLGRQTRRLFKMEHDEFLDAWRKGEIDRDDERLKLMANVLVFFI